MGPEDADESAGDAGTTLVELLVAMALLALIALFIGQGVMAVRASAPLAARMDGSAAVTAARDHLRRTLGEAVIDLGLAPAAAFEGGPETLAFLAPADPVLEVGGLNRIVLALEARPDGDTDLVEWRAVARGDLSAEARRTVLVADVKALRFSYAGSSGGGETPVWHDEWREAGVLPALVQVELRLAAGDRRRFPPLLVHPLASPAANLPDSAPASAANEGRGTASSDPSWRPK